MAAKNIGGYIQGIRRRLRAAGVADTLIDEACAVGGRRKTFSLRFPKKVKLRLADILQTPGDRAVLMLAKSGKLRVYRPEAIVGMEERGRRLGSGASGQQRRPKITPERIAAIRAAWQAGKSMVQIRKETGAGFGTIAKYTKALTQHA